MIIVRIGNNIHVLWKIYNNTGSKYSLSGKVRRLWLSSAALEKEIDTYQIQYRNELVFTIDAGDLTRYGTYKLVLQLSESDSQTEDATYDLTQLFQIVARTYPGACKELDGEVDVQVTSVLNNVVVERIEGLSAYEIAVNEGYVGTESEWIESLNGVGIASIDQTVIAVDDGSYNEVTFTMTNGETYTIRIRNGSKSAAVTRDDIIFALGYTPVTPAELAAKTDIFFAKYNSTTWREINEAVNAGKAVFLKKDEDIYPLVGDGGVTPKLWEFAFVDTSLDHHRAVCHNDDTWQSGIRGLASVIDLANKQDVISDLSAIRAGAALGATAYQKPSTGIPASDIASGVIPDISGKQDTLISGSNIKTINGSSILGSGDIQVQTEITMDNVPTSGSNNPVKSGGLYTELAEKIGSQDIDNVVKLTQAQYDALQSKDPRKVYIVTDSTVPSDHVGVAKIEQTTTSTADGGTNVITCTLTNDVTTTFQIKNGNQGNSGYTGAAGELEVVNNLTQGGATAALSAEMGKTLEGEISQLDTLLNEKQTAINNQNQRIEDFKDVVEDMVENYPNVTYEGDVTNMPDGEDLTTDSDNHLKLANRPAVNGMGYVILRKNKTFAEQVTLANTIYEIRYDFDLGGASVTIPAGSELKFEGGSVKNGYLSGELHQGYIDAECFGFVYNDPASATRNAQCFEMIGALSGVRLNFNGDMFLETTEKIEMESLIVRGNGKAFYVKGNNAHIFNVKGDVKIDGLRIIGDSSTEQRLVYMDKQSVCDICLTNCYFSGNLTVLRVKKTIDSNFTNYVNDFIVTDNIFENINGFWTIYDNYSWILKFDDTAVRNAIVKGNSVHNFYGEFLTIGTPSNNPDVGEAMSRFDSELGINYNIVDNHFYNDLNFRPWDKFEEYIGGYLSPCVLEFGTLRFANNTIENIIGYADNVYVYWLYSNALHTIVENNRIVNVLNLKNPTAQNELLKAKGGFANATKRYINNYFRYSDLSEDFGTLTGFNQNILLHGDTGSEYSLLEISGNVFDLYLFRHPVGKRWMAKNVIFNNNTFKAQKCVIDSMLVAPSNNVAANIRIQGNDIQSGLFVDVNLEPITPNGHALNLVSLYNKNNEVEISNNVLSGVTIIHTEGNWVSDGIRVHDNIIKWSPAAFTHKYNLLYNPCANFRFYNNKVFADGYITLGGLIENCEVVCSTADAYLTEFIRTNAFPVDGYFKILVEMTNNATGKSRKAEVNIKRASGVYTVRGVKNDGTIVTLSGYTDLKNLGDDAGNISYSLNALRVVIPYLTIKNVSIVNISQADFDNDVFLWGNPTGTTATRPIFANNTHGGFTYFDTTLAKEILWNGTTWVNVDGSSLTPPATSGTTENRPAGVSTGFIYFDTTLGKSIVYSGSAWVNMDGTAL